MLPSSNGDSSLAALKTISSAANAWPLDQYKDLRAGADLLACSVGTEETKTDLKVGLSPDPNARIPKPVNELSSFFIDLRLTD
jgi:hypothetical protein